MFGDYVCGVGFWWFGFEFDVVYLLALFLLVCGRLLVYAWCTLVTIFVRAMMISCGLYIKL